jgi:hypothetical protein
MPAHSGRNMRDPASSIRPRLAATLTELQQQNLITKKLAALAMDTSYDSARRVFHGEADMDLPQYISLINDCDVAAAAKLAVATTVHDGTGLGIHQTECGASSNTHSQSFDCLHQAVELARAEAEIWRDKIITPDELALHRAISSQLRAILDEMDARVAAHVGGRRIGIGA